MKITIQLLWFSVAGIVGFCVDAGLLYMLKGALGLLGARAISFVGAVVATWVINRAVTFRSRTSNRPLGSEFLVYTGLMLGGGVVNNVAFVLLVKHYELVAKHPIIAVAAGSLAGMIVNFCTSRFLLYRFRHWMST